MSMIVIIVARIIILMKIMNNYKLLKDGTLHDEGKILNFRKKGPKKFPTHEEKKKSFKK